MPLAFAIELYEASHRLTGKIERNEEPTKALIKVGKKKMLNDITMKETKEKE